MRNLMETPSVSSNNHRRCAASLVPTVRNTTSHLLKDCHCERLWFCFGIKSPLKGFFHLIDNNSGIVQKCVSNKRFHEVRLQTKLHSTAIFFLFSLFANCFPKYRRRSAYQNASAISVRLCENAKSVLCC